jgi:hypothetical protein
MTLGLGGLFVALVWVVMNAPIDNAAGDDMEDDDE